jgi:hypothetical protein
LFARQRERVDFWLDLLKQDEWELLQVIETLKRQRLFTKAVRDGIWLIWDLSQGRTEALLELFPWVAEHFCGTGSNGLTADQVREIVRLEAGEITANVETSGITPTLVSGNLRALAGSNALLLGPEDHDDLADLLEVRDVSSGGGGVATQNLINSMLALQSVKSDKPVKPSKSVRRERQSLEDMLEIKVVDSE